MSPARLLIIAGLALLVLGLLALGLEKLGLGRLPGDLVVRGRGGTLYLPIVTSIVLSLVLTLVLWLVQRWR